jgi:hypothetical protein
MKIITALFLTALGLQTFSQKKDTLLIVAGSKHLQPHLLKDYISSYDFFSVKDGAETLIGSLDDQFQIMPKKKQALRVCKIKFGNNSILDSGLCELRGLSPIYHRSAQTKKNINLAFASKKVKGTVTFKSESENKIENIDYQTTTPLFDSFYEDILAKAINLEKEFVFRFAEYIYEKGGTVWSVGEVINGENPSERLVRFYELNSQKEIVRTTTFVINAPSREIIKREYLMGSNKIVMRKKS